MDLVTRVASDGHHTGTDRMPELAVTSLLPNLAPPRGLDQSDHLPDLHGRAQFSPPDADIKRTMRPTALPSPARREAWRGRRSAPPRRRWLSDRDRQAGQAVQVPRRARLGLAGQAQVRVPV